MENHVIYFYRVKDHDTMGESDLKNGLFKLKDIPIIGLLESKNINIPSRKRRAQNYKSFPFEIQQKNFYRLIYGLSRADFTIVNIAFDGEIDEEISEELMSALHSRDSNQIINLIEEARYMSEVDIKSVTYNFKGIRFKLSKDAVVEITSDNDQISELLATEPLGVLIGTRRSL